MGVIKSIDNQGRIVLPKKWRDSHAEISNVEIEINDNDEIKIKPYIPVDITKIFDSIEVDIKADFDDWPAVEKEILLKRLKL